MDKIKRFFKEENVSRAFESKIFVWCWLAIVFVCWAFDGWVAGFIIAAVLAGTMLCLCKDTLPVLTILWTFLFMLGQNRHKLQGMAWLISAVAFIVVGMIVNIVRFRPSFKFLNYKKISVTTFALILFCAANMISGIARAERYQNFASHGLYATVVGLLCVVLAGGYIFFSATVVGGKDGKRVIDHILYLMFASSAVIVLQLVVHYLKLGGMDAVVNGFVKKDVEIGWGGPNNYSIVLAMMMPATFYFSIKNGKFSPLYFAYGLVQYFFVFMSASRGAILFGAVGLFVSAGIAVYKSRFRGRMIVAIEVLCAVAVVVCMAYADQIYDMMGGIMEKGLDENGRIKLWQSAIENFKNNPIFGTGFDFNLGGYVSKSDGYTPYWYHSTFFQALASTGIVGFAAWIYLEISRARAFLTRPSTEKWFALVGFAIFWAYTMIDVFYYAPNGLLYLFMFTLAIEKSVPRDELRPIAFELAQNKALQKKCGQEYKREA